MLEIGDRLVLHYPVTTSIHRIERAAKRPREVIIKQLRDLVEEPLTIQEFRRRPLCNRSRWLARCYEIGSGFRQFYLGSSSEFEAPGHLRIALYDPNHIRPVELIGREYAPSIDDRKLMLRLLSDWESRDFGGLELRIIAADLRVIA